MSASKIHTADVAVAQPGFISFPGTTGNYMTTPITGALNILGDICIVAKVLRWDLPGGGIQAICGRYGTVTPYTNQRSWYFGKETASTKRLRFSWSSTGSSVAQNIPSNNSVPDTHPWVAVAFQPAVPLLRFWYSTDGIDWLERVITGSVTATAPTMFDTPTIPLGIGGLGSGELLFPGNIALVSIRDGVGAGCTVGGTEVFRFEGEDLDVVDEAATSFVTSTGHTLTVNRSAAEPKTAIYPFTYPQELVLKDKWIGDKRVWPIRDGYVDHGVAAGGNYSVVSTPAIAAYTTTDLDVRWFGAINWANSGGIFNQWDVNGGQRAWLMEMGGGQCRLSFSTTGANQYMSTLVNFPFGVGASGGVRFTRLQSSGLARLYFSTDGVNWVESVGGQTVMAAGTAMFASTAALMFGGYNTNGASGQIVGDTHYVELRNGIDGAVVFRHGPESLRGLTRKQASWTCETGQVVTRVGGASPGPWVYPTVDVEDLMDLYEGDIRTWPGGDGYADLPVTTGNYLSIPHRSEFAIIGDICIVARIYRVAWTGATSRVIVSRWGNIDGSYRFGIRNDGYLTFTWSDTGTGSTVTTSTVSLAAITPNTWLFLAVSFDVVSGADRQTKFWTSADNVNWTQLGATVTAAGGATSIFPGTDPLRVGVLNGFDSNCFDGRVGYLSIRDGIGAGNTVGGTEVFHLDRDSFKVGRRSTTIPATVQVTNTKSFAIYGGMVTTPDPGVPPDQFILIAELTAGLNGAGGAIKTIASHGPSAPNLAWRWLWVDNSTTAKTVRVVLSADGTAVTNFSVANIVPHSPGAHYYLAQSMEKVGANWTTIVYESEDGVVWTNRGTATAAFGTIFDTSADLRIGDTSGPHLADIHSFEMRTGLDPNAGTVLWKIDSDESTMPAMTYRQSGVTDFDLDGIADGWTTWQVGTVSSTKREVINGIQYVEAVLESNPSNFGVASPRFPVTNGTTYECSTLWYLPQAASSCTFSVRVYGYNAAGAFVAEYYVTGISGGSVSYLSDTNDTFTVNMPTIVSAEVCVGIGLSFTDTPGVTRAGFCGVRIGPASSYADPRGRTWSTTSAGVGNTIAYEPRDLTVNRSGTPALQIYPSVIPNPARWDEAQWDDGTDWS